MSEKKNIDRLFQEKFKDFEAAPPEFVWDNLEELLQKKKKRRVVPLWWRMGGIAAALVVGMLFLYPYVNSNTSDTTNTKEGVVYEQPTLEKGTQSNPNTTGRTKLQPNRSIQSQGPAAGNAVATGKVVDGVNSKSEGANPKTQILNSKTGNRAEYADGGSAANQQKPGKSFMPKGKANNKAREQMYAQGGNGSASGKPKGAAANTNATGAENGANGSNNIRNAQQTEGIANLDLPAADGQVATQTEGNGASGSLPAKDGLPPVAPEQGVAGTVTDSLQEPEDPFLKMVDEEQKNGKQEALAQNDKKTDDKGEAGKWNLKPQMGPLMYSSLSNGSPIDAQFAKNSKSYDNQMSYGLGFNYALTNRLSLRTGVNTVNLSYATQGVEFYASLNEGTNNVARTGDANIVVQTQQNSTNIDPTNAFATSDQLPKETFNGSMVQRTGYIEVPMEMSYAVLNNKFGIDVIGGFSTLFLNENNVSVVSTQGLSTDVGRAQNLNNISFSTNLGLGFTYSFLKQFKASFEPTFKYQLNTYNRDANNFRPYFIGLYTGISFSF
jgi:hypothetical protein